MNGHQKLIVLFDGHCGMCSGWVNFIRKRDRKRKFHFESMHTMVGQNILSEGGCLGIDAVVLMEGEKPFIKSDAVLRILSSLGFPWILSGVFRLCPRVIRDFFYDVVAAGRKRLGMEVGANQCTSTIDRCSH